MHAEQTHPMQTQDQHLVLEKLNDEQLIELLQTLSVDLHTLSISNSVLGAKSMRALAHCPQVRQLKHLSLVRCHLDDEAIEALCQWPQHFDDLEVLDLSQNTIGDKGVFALVQARAMRTLKHLHLVENQLTNRAVIAIATTHHLHHLEHLGLSGHQHIDDHSVRWLIQRAQVHFPHLNHIGLASCSVSMDVRLRLQQALNI